MASSSISNPARKRRKIGTKPVDTKTHISDWKTEIRQRSYSKSLLTALRQSSTATSSPPYSAVRVAVDRALAVAAKGRTRWSRAILTSRLSLKLSHNNNNIISNSNSNNNKRCRKAGRMRKRVPVEPVRKLKPVQKKAKVLSKLVPGCRKVSFPNLLEEASDYIEALEMQIRSMSALAGLLSTGSNLS